MIKTTKKINVQLTRENCSKKKLTREKK